MIVDRSAPLLDCTVTELLDRFAAKQPTPGGGGAAAITAAMAAGLLGMAARFSTAQLIDAASCAAYADRVRTQVAALAEQDAEAYQAVLAAFALPREPDPQVRRRQIRRALERAARYRANRRDRQTSYSCRSGRGPATEVTECSLPAMVNTRHWKRVRVVRTARWLGTTPAPRRIWLPRFCHPHRWRLPTR